MLARMVVAVLLLIAFGAAPAAAADGTLYCDGALDGGAAGAVTDAEQAVRVGDPPLPPGVSERRAEFGGVATRLLEAGPSSADEAIVFVHGNPGSARDFDAL